MRLVDLEPQFLRHVVVPNQPTTIVDDAGNRHEVLRDRVEYHHVDSVSEADGVMFLCPKCFAANGGAIGTHAVLCWRPGRVPDDAAPGPGRWEIIGTGYGDLSLVAGSSSILLTDGCRWHGYVRNGAIEPAG